MFLWRTTIGPPVLLAYEQSQDCVATLGVPMKYFDEARMANIQKAFDSEVLKWKDVVSRQMMGCLCYFRKRKFICFLVTDGIVLVKLSDKDQTIVKAKFGRKPFEMAGQTGRMWITPLKGAKDVKLVMPFVRKRYEEAL